MLFYKIEATLQQPQTLTKDRDSDEWKNMVAEMNQASAAFYREHQERFSLFPAHASTSKWTFGLLSKNALDVGECFAQYEKKLPGHFTAVTWSESLFEPFKRMLRQAYRNDFVDDTDEILAGFSILEMSDHRIGGENMIQTLTTQTALRERATQLLFGSTLVPEIQRIYAGSALKPMLGHPVHYLIRCTDKNVRREIWQTLLSALYQNGRLQNQRYCFVDVDQESSIGESYAALYRSCIGGAVVVRYESEDETGGDYAFGGNDGIHQICALAQKYKNQVLTILCLPKTGERLKEKFLFEMGNAVFVELYEDVVFNGQARNYLTLKAKELGTRTDQKLFDSLAENQGYTAADLNRIFDTWYDHKLRNRVYPQYKTAQTVKANIQAAKVKGSAYERLSQLIGLKEAKQVMADALDYYKAQKLFADQGICQEKPAMHMVFTGNPGTAKTSVARLFAAILKDNGILTDGNLYEVGRADLVGQYVGHTAPMVKAQFKRARGGVLFIDEAYSLVDDRDGMFGDEAINTIVQEMENYREDVIVIFAGYPDKMEGFLNKNPGLRSRIAFHVPFSDYNTEELCQIADLMAADQGLTLDDSARAGIETVCASASAQPDFGNGRFVRNLMERARLKQANRLVKMDLSTVTAKDITTLCGDDIEMPLLAHTPRRSPIGFA